MKQITNKEYEEWQKYKAEKAKGHILLPDTVRFICEANGYDAEKIGQHFLEILPKICPACGALTDRVHDYRMQERPLSNTIYNAGYDVDRVNLAAGSAHLTKAA